MASSLSSPVLTTNHILPQETGYGDTATTGRTHLRCFPYTGAVVLRLAWPSPSSCEGLGLGLGLGKCNQNQIAEIII